MRIRLLLLSFAFWALVIACGGSKQMAQTAGVVSDDSPCPAWFFNVPVSPDTVFGVATRTSKDLQFALQLATVDAQAGIGSQLKSKLQETISGLITQVGNDAEMVFKPVQERVIERTLNMTLSEAKVLKQSTKKEGEVWRGCVLVACSVRASNRVAFENLQNEELIKGRQDLYDALQRMKADLKNQ